MGWQMTGRDLYVRYNFIIEFLVRFFSLFHPSVLTFIYSYVRLMDGSIGEVIRYLVVRNLTAKCGGVVKVGPGVTIKNIDKLEIGERVNIHENTYIDAIGGVSIGDDVSVAHGCSVLSFEHGWNQVDVPIKYNELVYKSVVISSDVWIGCGVRVLAGAKISSRSVIAAGSVVTSGTYSSGIYGGVPAKFLKSVD
jgi:acetyltransferase-like isoleucine patch superfamily enzyme